MYTFLCRRHAATTDQRMVPAILATSRLSMSRQSSRISSLVQAAGSSLLAKICHFLVLDALRRAGLKDVAEVQVQLHTAFFHHQLAMLHRYD